MNKDDDERLIGPGSYRNALNVDVISTESEDAGTVRNKKGNTLIGSLGNACGYAVDSSFKCIGAVSVDAENKLYYLIASDFFDGVFEYNEITGNISRILQADKATPTTASKLNFDKEYYVTGFEYLDGFLIWTDNLNEPFYGKVSRWRDYDIDDDRIDLDKRLIKSAPLHSPVIELKNADDEENNMEKRYLQFAYRYKYIDDQYSAFSPFSSVAFDPGAFNVDYAAGNNEAMLNTKNRVDIRVETGNKFVKGVEIMFRDTKSLNVSLIEYVDKEKEDIPNNNVYTFTDFDNDKVYTVIPDDQLTRLWDNVPLKAKALDIIGSRVVFGNYVQFYDMKDGTANENDVKINLGVDYISEDVAVGQSKQTFRSDRDYEVGIIYGDDDGRFTTVFTSKNNTTYIKPENSVTANSLKVTINHEPPSFATHYRLVVKQAKQSYYNIFPILYYADGVYRYFLINESDKDKFKVGEYVIFKSDGSAATLSNKEFKILEFEAKGENFLSNGSQTAGLYFKVKADAGDFPASAVTTFSQSAYGSNFSLPSAPASPDAIENPVTYTENPIFYGTSSNGGALSVSNGNAYAFNKSDTRVFIEVHQAGKFRYRFIGSNNISSSLGSWSVDQVITPNVDIPIQDGNSNTLFDIQFSTDLGFDIGDSWRINCRGNVNLTNTQNVFGGNLKLMTLSGTSQNTAQQHGGFAPFPSDNFAGPINSGAVVKIWIYQDSSSTTNPQSAPHLMEFISSGDYENIEEWFFEDEIYSQWTQVAGNTGLPTGPESVYFRRGTYETSNYAPQPLSYVHYVDAGGFPITSTTLTNPVRMIVRGYNTPNDNKFIVNFYVTQLENPLLCETQPAEVDVDIFHEMTDTYPISGGKHHVLWDYEDYTAINSGVNAGKIRLGQADPTSAPTTQRPHKFQAGDTINVVTTIAGLNGTFTVLAPDANALNPDHNVIIDLAYATIGAGPITPGTAGLSHGSGEVEIDQTNQPATVIINHPQNPNCTYNAYTFGNGLESERILDDFNETRIQYSPRVTTIIEGYKQERKKSSLTFSNVYQAESSTNRLNEFNLAKGNFKNLDKEFGSVQKLYARDNDLIVFQENKVSQVLYEKNLLSDSIGGGSVTSVPQVLGTQIAYKGEWGISSNPESFAEWGNEIFFTDARRGAVIKMTSGGSFDIAENGMKSYFRDLFKNDPNTMKIGVYDPYKHQYIIASNDDPSIPCSLELSIKGNKYPANTETGPAIQNESAPDFSVISNTDWTATISYSAGSGWVVWEPGGFPITGFGDRDVYLAVADNTTGSTRTATITFTYCGGLTKEFLISQGAGKKGNVVIWVNDNIFDWVNNNPTF
jgi:hypothetical protein